MAAGAGGLFLSVLLCASGFCHNEEMVTEAGGEEGILHESQIARLTASWDSQGGSEI